MSLPLAVSESCGGVSVQPAVPSEGSIGSNQEASRGHEGLLSGAPSSLLFQIPARQPGSGIAAQREEANLWQGHEEDGTEGAGRLGGLEGVGAGRGNLLSNRGSSLVCRVACFLVGRAGVPGPDSVALRVWGGTGSLVAGAREPPSGARVGGTPGAR